MVGACEALLHLSLEHARNRRQFDQPIGAFQAIQHKCADMLVQVEKARASAYFATLAIAEDDPRRTVASASSSSL
jgi:alkylation response protein AidB-like acyl-CoA dehydrogenase